MSLQQLSETRKYLEEKFQDFPASHCLDAAEECKRRFGFEIVEGVILCEDGPQHHIFNYDPTSKNYIDLSADQFPGVTHKILITLENESAIYKGIRRH